MMSEAVEAGDGAAEFTVPVLEFATVGDAKTNVVLDQQREYVGGAAPGVDFQSDFAGTAGQHFTIRRGPAYCLLKPLEPVSLNDRDVHFAVQLTHGDEIRAGESVFRYNCPQDGSFPCLRISNTLWILRIVPEPWQFSPETGLFRYLDEEFVENIYFTQDEVPHNNLPQYLDEQFRYLALVVDDFTTQAMQAAPLYQSETCALHRHEFSIQDQAVVQYQYFVLKNKNAGIVSWTVPLSVESDQDRLSRFFSYLQHVYFG